MDRPFGLPRPMESSITHEQGIPAEFVGHYLQIPPIFPNPMSNPMCDFPGKPQSVYFKTRMCVRFTSGCCPKGSNCNFAHSIEELRRPVGNVDKRASFLQKDRSSRNESNIIIPEVFDPREEQKLSKNKICWKFYNGEMCPYGDKCSFSHVGPGSLQDNPLFNQKSLCWKTKICHKWLTSGNCPYGDQCSYAHGDAELRKLAGDNNIELVEKNVLEAPPKCTSHLSDDILSKTMKEPEDRREIPASQPKVRALSLRKISRIYGDWIDDTA
ncbi:zinc finger CCCH domain-containing protein 39-like [Phalaenopsis equestris]|uniref:zinc finger CCCH domain-containing protein 39-like n=1 Tax=Phalaenopsis equestris TaxID=78828 RepID=UPI0009E51D81|nr:zinc finger CCCH domain-containing protein 39-like [Phalaenopsis equestris]